eukprot:g18259.t1
MLCRVQGVAVIEKKDIELSGDQIEWLRLMVTRFDSVRDVHHALQALIYYAMQEGNLKWIFAKIRCRKCGRQFFKQTYQLGVLSFQWAWLHAISIKYKIPSIDKAVRVLLDFAQEGLSAAETEAPLFTTGSQPAAAAPSKNDTTCDLTWKSGGFEPI